MSTGALLRQWRWLSVCQYDAQRTRSPQPSSKGNLIPAATAGVVLRAIWSRRKLQLILKPRFIAVELGTLLKPRKTFKRS